MKTRCPFCILGLIGLTLLALACSNNGDDNAPANQVGALSVITTIYPLEYFAQRIGGDLVEVANLVSPGVEAHDFEPSSNDIRDMDSADVIIYNGAGFEPWIDRAINAVGSGSVIIEASRGLLDGVNGQADPHVWLDPIKAAQQAALIRDALSEADPDNFDMYVSNAAQLLTELEQLDERYEAGLTTCGISQFVTSHAAFGHLAARYRLEQIAVSGLSPEAQPAPRDLANVVDTIRDLDVKFVMVEPIVNSAIPKTLAAEVGASLLPLHPLATLTKDETARGETYFSIMDSNLENLRVALECN